MDQQQYRVGYTYDNPHGAGPFKGSIISNEKHSKGDQIHAAFGRATVISCRVIKK